MSSSQMYTQDRDGGRRSDLTVRVPANTSFEVPATQGPTGGPTGSAGSAQTDSPCSSGSSLSQLGRQPAPGQDHAAQQPPTTPCRAHVTSSASQFTSPPFSRGQAAQNYGGSPHMLTPKRVSELQSPHRQRSSSNASQMSNSPRRPSFTSSLRSPSMVNQIDPFNTTSLSGVPEHLAVSGLAFRQGQHDHGSSRNRIPPNPFASQFDQLWAEYYRLGAVQGGPPAALPSSTSPSHENFAWTVLINTETQDLEHPNGSYDMDYARSICIMGLKCMRELIQVVCKRNNDWRKIVCDVPAPLQQAITHFPDLCAKYKDLKQEAREALGGGIPLGYNADSCYYS
ncbi:hypothetical protein A1F94_003093 [Pyrenophora tritici-repentis]|uniref:Atrophin-1 domain containing protein n=1 Tax=Pyrenophora tritici-repentis TaxID=45151 RepID=A0A2W1DEW9_9PLEO|nr:hypothetical protein PtrV1_04305 [Pyrenophora tritici-repentis]KAF7574891.1 Atrophin-1 domain containing protein [Pyrenophora tritici-repentis]KAG9386343.1 hypothetical protein A1F94_003093 [Pyrenophora tritici-repentis]KAI0570871.1 hypothetical protein Alg215_10780 [Pyrenophora tritici-repentis]KAI0576492.1 hypothetical protein Alg130_08777 [Pyrenophora tritici-repentis]